jgi:hypothetical protein
MRFLLDENMPDTVADFFRLRKYEVLLTREAFATGTPDALLAFASDNEGLIIVTRDKDFKQLKSMLPQGYQNRITSGSGQIVLHSLSILQIVPRLEQEWAFIEFGYQEAIREQKRFICRVTNTQVTFVRNATR